MTQRTPFAGSNKPVTPILAILLLTAQPAAGAVDCGKEGRAEIAGKSVWKSGNGVGFDSAERSVDADGAPNSYMVDGSGLSRTCDGAILESDRPAREHPGWDKRCVKAWAEAERTGDYTKLHIYGFLHDKSNKPLVQKAGDPFPDRAFISSNILAIPGTDALTQLHWADATKIPYIVLPGRFASRFHIAPGDLAVVFRPLTGKWAFAVYGDCCGYDEASVKLHQVLGANPLSSGKGPVRADRNLKDRTMTIVFPGVKTHPVPDAKSWYTEILTKGESALAAWGGKERLEACALSP